MARKKPKPPDNPWDETYIESLAFHKDYVKEARKVLNKGGFGAVQSRADGRGWWVECKGMTGTYQVSVRPDSERGFVAECSCPSNKKPCKHSIALLLYLAAHPEERIEPTVASTARSFDLDALIRAVFASPREDTPRLILADCVQELGQPARAALIRLQCERAQIGIGGAQVEALEAEEARLMPIVREEMGPIPDSMRASFERGFVTLVAADGWWRRDLGSYPARFPELFRDGWIETFCVRNAYDLPPWLIGLFQQVRLADFSGADMGDRELVALASDLQPGRDGARLQSVLVPTQFAGRYRELTAAAGGVTSGTQTTTGLVSTYHGRDVGSSRRYENLNPAQFELLSRAGHFRGAHSLNLVGGIGDEGITTLLATPGLGDLAHLEFTKPEISANGLKELASSPLADRLRWLGVQGSAVGTAGADALCGATWGQLTKLSLGANNLTDASSASLAAGRFPALGFLDLRDNMITRAGAAVLLRANQLARVATWELAGNPVAVEARIPLVLGAEYRAHLTVNFDDTKIERSHTTDKPDELHLRVTGTHERMPGLFLEWAGCARSVVSLVLAQLRFDAAEMERLATALTAHPLCEIHFGANELRNEAVAGARGAARRDETGRARPQRQ
ncbi:swim zinc finger domain protein : Ankyrin repeat domain protein OS=Wolbachia endosymbiont of Drosophila simulans wHa GN=wHa_02660 PE=4 SV=1: SWIM [Gemmata massiliana]|uniref:SWIM-type domain-containing protein n=1 Tax=Gemmata massiliana TaxID=1210884 RepID=A0A6P2CTN8_9BACT|nr:TIGR02996 domain-containing protein [Gemmata massiliana]VTR92319.1 swim zinc finger domain protein : Ankyrin repeat domain protein OS=Wolbachia endosymbiont of Drosophila simulans wHa GN=wHa_02660 PE=4 SV=1: SWIM [Gemmata massiliana]